ncbi:MAG TPA: MBL fold metallo-hydrolase [Terriglobales bacterium]|nr:MBL fold metallo-hydrolase [Terriglobales bacterium]
MIAVADDNSVLLINSGMADRVTELAHTVYEAVQRPVTTLVNTDWHFDHTGGNQYFSSFGVTIIAQANTKKRIAAEHKSVRKTYAANNPSSFNVVASPWAAAVENPASERYALRGIPTVAFDESMTINLDNEELIFCHYGAGHTDGDTVVFFQTSNLVLLGDIFPGHEYPWIDVRSGGSLAGVIQTVDRVLSASNEQTRIIPGQGPVLHKAELQDYRNMLVNIQARIQELLESGASADQIIAAAPTSDFDSEWGGGDVSGQVFTSLIIESMAQGR